MQCPPPPKKTKIENPEVFLAGTTKCSKYWDHCYTGSQKILITWSIFMLVAKSLLSRLSRTKNSMEVHTLISKLLLETGELTF